jgi:peptide chain release factor 3
MNPRHRDGIAFMRVVSGKFERGMDAVIGRSGEVLRLSKPHTFLGDERSLVEEAWPGDIVGLYNTGKLRVGDTLSNAGPLKFAGIPRFAPEHFVTVRLEDPMKRKALDSGLEQLSQEGVIQLFFLPGRGRQNPYLGAVGLLQFEVLKERLKNEYRVAVDFAKSKYTRARWIGGAPSAIEWLRSTHGYALVEDRHGQPVVLTDSDWNLSYALEKAPGLLLFDVEPL